MTRSELVRRLSERNPQLLLRDAERVVFALFDEISAALARGARVELRGFGSFSLRHRSARAARNPRTGASIEITEKFLPSFKPGKELRAVLSNPARLDTPS
jgi:integration host factor subunit beta